MIQLFCRGLKEITPNPQTIEECEEVEVVEGGGEEERGRERRRRRRRRESSCSGQGERLAAALRSNTD